LINKQTPKIEEQKGTSSRKKKAGKKQKKAHYWKLHKIQPAQQLHHARGTRC